ncbi:MAG: leucyl/phenylalanyl-tRNA--protein transferase [Phycisphaerae bacterium]|nr:leucyl/phenylalanyl-tRNA--protein transferase [Phycisphaerae bacterium]
MRDLDPGILLAAYAEGYFPMAHPETGELEWFNPDPRCILPLDALRVPESLARRVRSGRFQVTTNTEFEMVMRACADTKPGREETWIDDQLIDLYGKLHERGLAHSVEAWRDGVLVGGLYGVHLGGVFMGESMFSLPEKGGSDASKVSLVWLVAHLRSIGVSVLDVQFISDHMARMGAIEVPRDEYLQSLMAHRDQHVSWSGWPTIDSVL